MDELIEHEEDLENLLENDGSITFYIKNKEIIEYLKIFFPTVLVDMVIEYYKYTYTLKFHKAYAYLQLNLIDNVTKKKIINNWYLSNDWHLSNATNINNNSGLVISTEIDSWKSCFITGVYKTGTFTFMLSFLNYYMKEHYGIINYITDIQDSFTVIKNPSSKTAFIKKLFPYEMKEIYLVSYKSGICELYIHIKDHEQFLIVAEITKIICKYCFENKIIESSGSHAL